MPSILIADSSKPSVVMTSEIFKDKIPGIAIHVAETGRLALELIPECNPDLCVVDFDLPDVDGPALVDSIRKHFDGPILMTAYPDEIVSQAVEENLFTCADASSWLAKPVNVAKMNSVIDKFLKDGHRINKRFNADLETQLVGRAAGRGKRAPKVDGKVTNMSICGVRVKLSGTMKLKKQQELVMSIMLPEEGAAPPPAEAKKPAKGKKPLKKKATLKTKKAPEVKGVEMKIKGKVAWASSGNVGVSFNRLTEIQKRSLLEYLRACGIEAVS